MSAIVACRAIRRLSSALPCQHSYSRLHPAAARATVRAFAVSTRAPAKKYTEDHEWIEVNSDGKTGTIGISTYAAKALGDVVFVELPTADLEVNKGESIGAVESVKSASDIMSPVSGRITEANSVLEEKPGTINQSPEGDGWLARIELKDVSEVEDLMDAEGYTKFTEEADGH